MQICFGPFTLDLDTRQLTRDGGELHLSPKAFELLAALVEERPKVLSKTVLQQRLWPDTFVAEANLSNLVAEIREALGDAPREPRYHPHGPRVRLRLLRRGHHRCRARTRRTPGGRNAGSSGERSGFRCTPANTSSAAIADVEIRLDASTVSRRHARLIVKPEGRCSRISAARTARTAARSRHGADPARRRRRDPHRSQLVTFRVRTMGSTDTQTVEMA